MLSLSRSIGILCVFLFASSSHAVEPNHTGNCMSKGSDYIEKIAERDLSCCGSCDYNEDLAGCWVPDGDGNHYCIACPNTAAN